ncbi:hypothetical protein [Oerskovia enterophila]|uniref:hypothetical protein n=1 Tax=Oerskovia enterophila TaxID=43678 RepID=UPI0038236803
MRSVGCSQEPSCAQSAPERELVGCAGDAVPVKGWGYPDESDCGEPKPGLVPGAIDVPVG